MKRKSPPRTPSKAHSPVPYSGTHGGTVLVSAPVTQHFPHSTFSLPLFLLAAFICMREMSCGLPSVKEKKKKIISIHLAGGGSQIYCTSIWDKPWHCLCTWTRIHAVALNVNTKLWLWLWNKAALKVFFIFFLRAPSIWNVSAACTKGRSVVDKQLLLPLTLSQGDVMQVRKRKKERKNLSGAAEPDTAQVTSQPHSVASPLITPWFPLLSPLSISHLKALHICEKVIISLSGAAGCHAACQPQEEKVNVLFQWRTVCFNAISTPAQYFTHSCKMVFEIARPSLLSTCHQ